MMGTTHTILYINPNNSLYGSDVSLLAIIRSLDQRIYRPIVVLPCDLPYPGILETQLDSLGVKTYHIRMGVLRGRYLNPIGLLRTFFDLISALFTLAHIIRSESVDVVHSNTLSVLCGAIACAFCHKKHIWQVQEFIVRPKVLYHFMSWFVPRISARVVTISHSLMDHLKPEPQYLRKYSVIYNGIDVALFSTNPEPGIPVRQAWGVRGDQVLIGMLGRVSANKGQRLFIDVAARIAKMYPQARFAIVGDVFPGFESILVDLKERCTQYGLDQVVTWSPFRTDAYAVMQALDIYIMPSAIPEGLGLVVLEAMASGKPVVGNARGGYTEAIEQGRSGILVEPDNPEKMATAIGQLIDSPEERTRIGKHARERVMSAFNLTTMVSAWLEIYTSLLAS